MYAHCKVVSGAGMAVGLEFQLASRFVWGREAGAVGAAKGTASFEKAVMARCMRRDPVGAG